jgi:hypothetical protein
VTLPAENKRSYINFIVYSIFDKIYSLVEVFNDALESFKTFPEITRFSKIDGFPSFYFYLDLLVFFVAIIGDFLS